MADFDAECPGCGKEYSLLGHHWTYNPDHRPDISSELREVITGVLMSDGYIDTSSSRPRLVINSITEQYLEYLDDLFGILSTGCRSVREEDGNFNEVFQLKTRTHPKFKEFAEWYGEGGKVWPCEDIVLTPTVLKHLYVGDGCYENYQTSDYITIGMKNELGREDRVAEMFESSGFPVDRFYKYEQKKDGEMTMVTHFTKAVSHEMFDYMGEPLPGFEYKWPEGW